MSDVQFEDSNLAPRRQSPEEKHGRLMKFLLRKGLSKQQARNMLGTIAVIAFLLSLFFWF